MRDSSLDHVPEISTGNGAVEVHVYVVLPEPLRQTIVDPPRVRGRVVAAIADEDGRHRGPRARGDGQATFQATLTGGGRRSKLARSAVPGAGERGRRRGMPNRALARSASDVLACVEWTEFMRDALSMRVCASTANGRSAAACARSPSRAALPRSAGRTAYRLTARSRRVVVLTPPVRAPEGAGPPSQIRGRASTRSPHPTAQVSS
jgi:hypothetical protein